MKHSPIKTKMLSMLLCLTIATVASYGRPRDNNYTREADELTHEQALEYLLTIRNFSYDQDYVFRFKLKHYPPKARKRTYYGTLYGHTDPKTGDHYERLVIENKSSTYSEASSHIADVLFKRGHTSEAWITQKIEGENSLVNLQGKDLIQPIIPEITLTYFDLLAPYLYWNQYKYEGPGQIKARPAQTFRFLSNNNEDSILAVEVNLDDEFRAVLKTRVFDLNDQISSSMELLSFKKTSGQYIPKTIEYRDYINKGNKSQINIIAAAMDLTLPLELFTPEEMNNPFPKVKHFVFDVF